MIIYSVKANKYVSEHFTETFNDTVCWTFARILKSDTFLIVVFAHAQLQSNISFQRKLLLDL